MRNIVFYLASYLGFGPRLKTERNLQNQYCPSVCPCDTEYLRNRSEDFSETRHEVGGKKCKKRSTAAFFRFLPVFSKTAHLCEKKPFLAIFGSFWNFAENPFRGFSLNRAKMCQQNSSQRQDSRFAWESSIFLRFWVKLYPKIDVNDPKFSFWHNFRNNLSKLGHHPIFRVLFRHFF